MFTTKPSFTSIFLVLFSLIFSLDSDAREQLAESNASSSESIEQADTQQQDSNNFYEFKAIVGAGYQSQLYLENEIGYVPVLAITFDGEYNDWFVESNSRNRISGALGRFYLGYHLWETDTQGLDLIWGHYSPAIDKTDEDEDEIPALVNLNTRRDDQLLGVRYSNWESDTYYSLEAGYDIFNSSHQGFVIEGYLGRVAVIRNWDLVYGLGATWYSNKVTNYNVGVKDSELTDELFAYSTSAGYAIDFEISAQTPISENWVFQIALEHTLLSSHISNSPLVVNDQLSSVLLGFSYVF